MNISYSQTSASSRIPNLSPSKSGFGTTPPLCLPLEPDNVPAELRNRKQWVCWVYSWTGTKWTKVPKQADGWRAASSTDARTWSTFDRVLATYRANRVHGIGFVTCARDPYVLIDLDHAVDPLSGMPAPLPAEIVRAAVRERAYAEFSPSATGFHIIGRGEQGFVGAKANDTEMYCRGRFFTITGGLVGKRLTRSIGKLRDTVTLTRARIGLPAKGECMRTPDPLPKGTIKCPYPKGTTDAQILELAFRAKNGERLKNLLDGDTSEYASDSEADAATASRLAFWFWLDPKAIERVMRNSRLKREKWDRNKRYLARTIRFSLKGRENFYGK